MYLTRKPQVFESRCSH